MAENARRIFLRAAIVVGVVVAAMAAVLPTLIRTAKASRQQTDRDHLQRMWELFITHNGRYATTPRARGFRFWLALAAGDAAENGLHPHAVFVSEEAGLLVSPNDPVAEPAVVEFMLAEIVAGRRTAHELTAAHTSYAGPRASAFRAVSPNAIIGATGSRDGNALYPGEFIAIRQNLATSIESFDTATRREPDWAAAEFAHLAPLGLELPAEPFSVGHRWPFIVSPPLDPPQTAPQ